MTKLGDKKLFPFRLFTTANTFLVLSEYDNIESLWRDIIQSENGSELNFWFPVRDGREELVEMKINTKYVIAIDNSHGDKEYKASKEPDRSKMRTINNNGSIDIGQSAKRRQK